MARRLYDCSIHWSLVPIITIFNENKQPQGKKTVVTISMIRIRFCLFWIFFSVFLILQIYFFSGAKRMTVHIHSLTHTHTHTRYTNADNAGNSISDFTAVTHCHLINFSIQPREMWRRQTIGIHSISRNTLSMCKYTHLIIYAHLY